MVNTASKDLVWTWSGSIHGEHVVKTLTKKKYSKLFGESLFKTIKKYSNYSSMLNWRTIGETIEINRQKVLKYSNYSPMLNDRVDRG